MNFEQLLRQAQNGDKKAQEEIFRMYRPLLIKNSMDINILSGTFSNSFKMYTEVSDLN